MGNQHGGAPPPMDVRIERCLDKFAMPMEKIEILWRLFTHHDTKGSGFLTYDVFLTEIIKYPRSPLTDPLPGLIEAKSELQLSFGEFTEIICTFCLFEQKDLLRYFWLAIDPNRSGIVEKNELKHFLVACWRQQAYSNVEKACDYLEETNNDITFKFGDIFKLRREYFWETHKANLLEMREAKRQRELAKLAKEQAERDKAEELANDEIIRKKMGIRYYIFPWQRIKERKRLEKIAAIESELESQYKNVKVKK